VLAKLACEKAKNNDGIYLIGKRKILKELKNTKVEEIWGIGKKTTQLFNRWGILDCKSLVEKSDEWLKTRAGKHGVELKHELLGECINSVNTKFKPPKSIQNTRSFPKFINDINYIKNALNMHIHTSCKKLRFLNGRCKAVSVMLRTKDFTVYWEQAKLKYPTNFELEISKDIMKMLEKIYSPNLIYRSCGVTLENIEYIEQEQISLFNDKTKLKKREKLGKSIDKLESKFGKNIVKTGFFETFKE